jgi:hypothetical protein
MNRQRLSAAIQQIRDYTKSHPELRAAHHFLYDLPLSREAGEPTFVVMGINPGEIEGDRCAIPGPTEETWDYDFHQKAEFGRSQGSINWRKSAMFFADTEKIVFTELFFWSSRNGNEFKQRFGLLWDSPHLSFCISMNRILIEEYHPKAIIFAGLSSSEKIARLFSLYHICTVRNERSRLVEHYRDEFRPWFFTKHFSAAWGFSNDQKREIKEYIQRKI